LSFAGNYLIILIAVGLVGIGSSIFHPESSRVAYLASGGRRGFAQSLFQVGGNTGTAIGPLLVILLVIPYGQAHILWFLLLGLAGTFLLYKIGKWYQKHLILRKANKIIIKDYPPRLTKRQVKRSIAILLSLIFSKYIYLTDRKSTRLNSSHVSISYAVFCLINKYWNVS